MNDRRSPSRSTVSRTYGHPWPWMVEEILRDELERRDGDVRELANDFGCHPTTVDKWVRRHGLRQGEGSDDAR